MSRTTFYMFLESIVPTHWPVPRQGVGRNRVILYPVKKKKIKTQMVKASPAMPLCQRSPCLVQKVVALKKIELKFPLKFFFCLW